MKQKKILLVLLIALIIFASFAYYEYQKITAVEKLDVQIAELQASNFTLSGFTLEIRLDVHNPNSIDVTVGRFSASASANGIKLASINNPEPISIPKAGTIQQTTQARINYLNVGIAVWQAIKDKNVAWRVQGTYELELPFGIKYPYAFDVQRTWSPSQK